MMTTPVNLQRPTTHHIALAMLEIGEHLHRHFRSVLAEMDLTPVQTHVLKLAETPIRMGALAEQVHCQASHITNVIDTLEGRGWIARMADPTDRRALMVVRTQAGDDIRQQIEERLAATTPPALAKLSEPEQQVLLGLLRKAIEQMPELEDHPASPHGPRERHGSPR